MNSLSTLEREVLRLFLDYPSNKAKNFQRQADSATIVRRMNTGAGIICDLSIDDADFLKSIESFELANVWGRHPQSPSGIVFILFIRAGRLSWLEGASCDGEWPSSPNQIEVFRKERDIEARLMSD
jgi:hypothetical protein